MRIIITGASGNIGSKLLDAVNKKGDSVIGLTRGQHDGLVSTDYNVESLSDIFSGADVVVHLASKRGSADDYRSFIENEITTENILKAMLIAKVPRIIFMSSIAVYSDKESLPWSETQYPTPQTFYGLSKLTCEYLCKQYSKKDINYIILRCGIVYGNDNTKRMISAFINEAIAKTTLILRGKSVAKRDFIYVKDVVSALLWGIYQYEGKNEIFNLGSGTALTNLEVANAVNDCFENSGNLNYENTVEEYIINSYMDSSKIQGAGFSTSFSFISALRDIRNDMLGW